MKMLQKINKKMRNTQIAISPLVVYVNHPIYGYGLGLMTVDYNLETSSMLMLAAKLPNRAGVKIGISWDFLYLKNKINEIANNISDGMFWNRRGAKWHNRLLYRLLKNV